MHHRLGGVYIQGGQTRMQSVLDQACRWSFYDTAAPPSFINKSEQIDSTFLMFALYNLFFYIYDMFPTPRPQS